MKAPQRRPFYRFLLGICASVSALLSFNIAPSAEDNKVEISTVSTRADYVTGGDVLVRVRVPSDTPLTDVTIQLNGTDVTSQFWTDAGGEGLTALLADLPLGQSLLEAKAKHGGADMIQIQNHLITGPVFSGPQEEPFFCQTHLFPGPGMGGPLTSTQIANPCFVPARVQYWYRPVGPTFTLRPFDPSGARPTDIATTISGVPYILRVETGTINRAIYQFAILDDPAIPGPHPSGGTDAGWNGRLIYTFGGGCNGGWYIQGASTGGVINDVMLTRGFAVASSSLNVLGNNCNDVVSAETLMMVKERFIEANGAPRYTIGWGCSGGAIQQYMIGDNYPGLLNGLIPQCSFPEQFGAASTDARLLRYYVLKRAAVPWSTEALRAASGFGTFGHIENQGTVWSARIDPVPNRGDGFLSALFMPIVPPGVGYDPVSNPTGARATVFDHNINTFGPDENGFARWPLDNVGIQYGLAALNAGQITVAQFLDLNEKIGGFDRDANFIAQRTVADHHATQAAYATGKIVAGGAGLSSVPILDVDVIYTDLLATGDIHLKYNHFSVRERLIKANGHADNMVVWSGANAAPRAGIAMTQALLMMDGWLANIAADTSTDSLATKVVRSKPASLTDGCWTGTTVPTVAFVAELQFFGGPGTSSCNTLYPAYGFPRLVAGAPLSNDIIKCRLRDIDPADYAVTLTPSEDARLRTIFPDGVCDYSLPGHDQRNLLDTWLTYEGGGVFKKSPR